jgi:hypothetical protein
MIILESYITTNYKKSTKYPEIPGEKKIETTIENCPKSTIANYK